MHNAAAADDGVAQAAVAAQLDGLAHEATAGDGLLDREQELGHVEGLEQVIEGARFGGLDGGLEGAVSGDQDDREPRLGAVQFADQVQPVQSRQFPIGDDHVEFRAFGPLQTRIAAGFDEDLVALVGEQTAEGHGDPRIVFHQQDFGRRAHADYESHGGRGHATKISQDFGIDRTALRSNLGLVNNIYHQIRLANGARGHGFPIRFNFITSLAFAGLLAAVSGQPVARAADTSAAAPEVRVSLIQTGSGPRKALRLHPKAEDKRSSTMTMKMGMEIAVAGMDPQKMSLPAMKMMMETSVKSVTPEGESTYETVMSDVSVAEDSEAMPQMVEAMKTTASGLKGVTLTGKMSSRGINQGTSVKTVGDLSPQARQTMEQMKDTFSNTGLALPEDAIGVGAKWEVKQKVSSQGMTIDQSTVYELVSLEGDKLKAKTTITQTAANQQIQNPAMPQMQMDLVKLFEQRHGRDHRGPGPAYSRPRRHGDAQRQHDGHGRRGSEDRDGHENGHQDTDGHEVTTGTWGAFNGGPAAIKGRIRIRTKRLGFQVASTAGGGASRDDASGRGGSRFRRRPWQHDVERRPPVHLGAVPAGRRGAFRRCARRWTGRARCRSLWW